MYRTIYIVWYILTLIFFLCIYQTPIATIAFFFWVALFWAGLNIYMSQKILNAAKKSDPQHYENIKYYFYNTRKKENLYSINREVQDLIEDYLEVNPFALFSIFILIIGELFINFS